MLVRAAGTGDSSQTASINASTDTGAVAVDQQHGQHGPLLRGAQRHRACRPRASAAVPAHRTGDLHSTSRWQPFGSTLASTHYCDWIAPAMWRGPSRSIVRTSGCARRRDKARSYDYPPPGDGVIPSERQLHIRTCMTYFNGAARAVGKDRHLIQVPVTAQRPDTARHPTKISRRTMNMLSPDQMPASPQPNDQRQPDQRQKADQCADHGRGAHERGVPRAEQHAVEGENDSCTRAIGRPETTTESRWRPAPDVSSVNSAGSTGAPAANTAARRGRRESPSHRHSPGRRCRTRAVACAQRRADQRLRRDGQRIQHQRKETPQLQHHLVGGHGRGSEPGRDRGSRDEAGLKRNGPHNQVAAEHKLGAHARPDRARSGTRSASSAEPEQQRGQPLTRHVGDGRPGQLQAGQSQPAVNQQRAQQRRQARSPRPHSAAGERCPARRATTHCRPATPELRAHP